MQRKKILFSAYSLNIGGIEKALIALLKNLPKYDITLVLEKKEGIFLNDIPSNVTIIEYRVSKSKLVIFRKIYNRIKLINFIHKIKNKFDFSCSFATYSIPGAHIALAASNNNALWMHANYYKVYNNSEDELKKFLDSIMINKFKRNIYVSRENMEDVTGHYAGIRNKAVICNNLINYKEIVNLSNEKIDEKDINIPTFVNISRHEESQKKLSRLLKATKRLLDEGYKFKLLFIGDGPDHELYKDYCRKNNLDGVVEFLGAKRNPYPYYNLADAIVLSSEYEGFPVVFLESMIFNKPIISTKVSDWEDLDHKYGIFVDNDDIYSGMKIFLDNGFKIKEKFDYDKYNNDILNKIENFINRG